MGFYLKCRMQLLLKCNIQASGKPWFKPGWKSVMVLVLFVHCLFFQWIHPAALMPPSLFVLAKSPIWCNREEYMQKEELNKRIIQYLFPKCNEREKQNRTLNLYQIFGRCRWVVEEEWKDHELSRFVCLSRGFKKSRKERGNNFELK